MKVLDIVHVLAFFAISAGAILAVLAHTWWLILSLSASLMAGAVSFYWLESVSVGYHRNQKKTHHEEHKGHEEDKKHFKKELRTLRVLGG